MLIIYCLILPIELVIHLHWWTALVMALFSLVVFGIEEIGSELENPFGRNPNDLPLDRICQTIASNIEELLKPQPHGEIYKQVVEIDNW
jgi:putative membrane protein